MQWRHIYELGIKELWALWRDPVMLVLIVYAFTLGLYAASTSAPETLQKAPIAVVDDDQSQLSARMIDALQPPHFLTPRMVDTLTADAGLDNGTYTFVLTIPPGFERDLQAGHAPELQLSVDATRMSQAFTGSGYLQAILQKEAAQYFSSSQANGRSSIETTARIRFNPSLTQSWFMSIMELINSITMLTIVLTGTALIREREHGTIEHLLVMPVTPLEIMVSKTWSMGLVVMCTSGLSLWLVVNGALGVPIQGSPWLFMCGIAMHLFATTALGIVMATVARSMPQFGLLLMLVLLPLEMLSGGTTPRESMPDIVQQIMLLAPTTHFVSLAQAILFRGAGFSVVWPQFAALLALGAVLFGFAVFRFRKTIATLV